MTTKTRQKLDRGVALNAVKQRNETNFKNLGLMNPHFNIKFAYVPKHREDMVVSMFPSEMECTDGVYMELTDGNNYPLFENAVLYKMRYNPYYKQGEYEIIPADITRNKNAETYLVPVSELELVAGEPTPGVIPTIPKAKPTLSTKNVDLFSSKAIKETPIDSGFEKEDNHYSELTVRDIAAIFLKTPVSNKKWLNQLINNISK